jgi:GNAT superfamily N-acetyltransferase
MKTTHRSYAEESGDFIRLCRFIVEPRDYVRAYSTWCIGRLVDWKYGLYESKLAVAGFCDQNAHFWFDAFGDLVGAAISENGDSSFSIITAVGSRFLFETILDWVLDAWADRGPRFTTEITEYQDIEIGVLERRGFKCESSFSTRRFDLTRPLVQQVRLEPGYAIVDMRSHPDYRAQRILRADVFENKDALSEEELLKHLQLYNYSHGGPIYHPECDLCVMAPDGQLVAGCEALIDTRNVEADIERVCTKRAYRNRGFARAVIVACLQRLRDIGMRSAYITGYSDAALALYGSLGHQDEKRCSIYEATYS